MLNSFLLYGANGYTGGLIARYAHQYNLQPILAGRNKEALMSLATKLNLPYKVIDLDDTPNLVAALKEVKLVVHAAGPFQFTAKQMVETSRIQGEIVVVSVYKKAPEVDLAAMHFKEISLTTTRCYTKEDFQTAIDLLASGEIAADSLISHKLPLEDIQAGFEFMQRPDESLKVLFVPNGEENEQ